MERVADYVIERLYKEGIGHIFMVTGRGILYLSDAVAKHEEMQAVCTHHEQAAAFAALAYTEANEKMGACLISTGCASTNAITGLLCAWQDNVPCIFISGQNKLKETTRYTQIPLRTFGNQEADIISIVEPITKYAKMITDPNDIAYEMDKAIYMANNGRKGPVWLDIPLDVQDMRVEREELVGFVPEEENVHVPTSEDLTYVERALLESERPVLLIGGGVRSSGAVSELEAFLEKCPIPVAYANSAVDVYNGDNPLSMGVVASIGGTRCGNFTVQNSDLLLVLGCRLSPQTTGSEYEKFARAAKVIVVDIDPVEHSKNTIKIDRLIISDVKKFLAAISQKNIHGASEEWISKCLHWRGIFPKCEENYVKSEKIDLHYLSQCISDTLDDNTILMSDSGLSELLVPSIVSFKKGQRCIHSASQGSMGFALPGTIGAYYGSYRPVVAVIGDGSIMMNLQEFQTISYNKIPVKILVINNNAYSVIRTRQEQLFRSRTIGTDPDNGVGCPDFEKVATCFDISYVKIEGNENLQEKLLSVFQMEGPVLCEVICVEDQKYLHSSYAFNSKRKLVRRPLEDQSPYLDRELFESEMIIEPIDQ
ncbi:thiamine pyrophosphate-binding protein [Paenibacillus motobuensis]|uniref:thiamine pyrophosphate-binding protein n=1 Tax=Paenibacillus TaxID=44249 RepID=UPI00203AFEB2|nr:MULTISPECIES: thiamine pyrophosphate-binding protein [Paenibacillus]MCM3040920.1 thiamine pyrophosphate-binding protein [Paenibacillus lutimineralis]MCM3648024.1 thiamine pyrophosphate-binding protein [Paenibacillus motobuensis]